MVPNYRIDSKTGAIIFQKTPEEKNLQEYLKALEHTNSILSHIVSQNTKIIEQNERILQLLQNKGGIADNG